MSRMVLFTALLGATMSMGCAVGAELDDAELGEDSAHLAKGKATTPFSPGATFTPVITPTASIPTASDAINENRVITRDCDLLGSVVYGNKGKWKRTYLTGSSLPDALGLREVCAYEWTSPTGDAPEITHLQNLPTWQYDLYAMSTLATGDELGEEADKVLHEQFLVQTDALAALPLATGSMSRVRTYVVDTAPTSVGGLLGPGIAGHGYSPRSTDRESHLSGWRSQPGWDELRLAATSGSGDGIRRSQPTGRLLRQCVVGGQRNCEGSRSVSQGTECGQSRPHDREPQCRLGARAWGRIQRARRW